MFNTDQHFLIGSHHASQGKPCQDYAFSDVVGDAAYAVVSDGCSSGGATDVGARLMCHATASILSRRSAGLPWIGQVMLERQEMLWGLQRTLLLSDRDMLATCLCAYLAPNGGYVEVLGDGVVGFVYDDGTIELHRFEWEGNAPYYPSYQGAAALQFLQFHGGSGELRFTQETWRMQLCQGFEHVKTTTRSVLEGMSGALLPLTEADVRRMRFVVVFSDGASHVDGYDWKIAAKKLLGFRNANGEFVTRRMRRFVQESRETGKGPLDDLACAAIHINHGESV